MLLQINTTPLDTMMTAAEQMVEPMERLSFMDLLFKGGWVMLPLGFLALVGLIIFFERYFTIRKAARFDKNLMVQVKQSILSGKLETAIAICRNNSSPLGRMLQKGLLRIGRPIKDIEGAIENVGKLEVAPLEKNMNILGIIAGIARRLGFGGAIIGVIAIFHEVEIEGVINIGTVSGGLYVKMVSSATGLIIGIIAYIGYHILNMMVDRIILRMETDAVEFIDLLDEPVS